MEALSIVAILFVAVCAVVLIAVTKSRSSDIKLPPPDSISDTGSPKTSFEPDRTATKPSFKETKDDPSAKWTYTKPKEKFVPQDTVYEYRRMAPCMLCPFCDAENDVGSAGCQVCGTSFRRGV